MEFVISSGGISWREIAGHDLEGVVGVVTTVLTDPWVWKEEQKRLYCSLVHDWHHQLVPSL